MAWYDKYTLLCFRFLMAPIPGTIRIIMAYCMFEPTLMGRFSLSYRRDEPKMIKTPKEVRRGAGTNVLAD